MQSADLVSPPQGRDQARKLRLPQMSVGRQLAWEIDWHVELGARVNAPQRDSDVHHNGIQCEGFEELPSATLTQTLAVSGRSWSRRKATVAMDVSFCVVPKILTAGSADPAFRVPSTCRLPRSSVLAIFRRLPFHPTCPLCIWTLPTFLALDAYTILGLGRAVGSYQTDKRLGTRDQASLRYR
jgi:hypothetical protein